MNRVQPNSDLVVLAADKQIEMSVRGLLTRQKSLGIRHLTVECLVHPRHDPGCVWTPEVLLRSYVGSVRYALVILDHEGSGCETISRTELELQIESVLVRNGWTDRAAAIVITPELESWVWSDSPLVDEMLGWKKQSLRKHLQHEGFWTIGGPKPERPKEAMTWALRQARKPRSSAIYRQLAENVGLQRCSDPAFHKLRDTLQSWFPPD